MRKLAAGSPWRRSKCKKRFGKLSRRVLAAVVADFFLTASGDLADLKTLHQLRIQGKRLRYTVEIVASVFDPALRQEIYPEIEAIQERIGVVNDHVMAAELLDQWSKQATYRDCAHVFQRMVELEHARTESSHREFLEWWDAPRRTRVQGRFEQLLRQGTNEARVTNVVLLGFQLQSPATMATSATRVAPWVATLDAGKDGT